eukprot:360271-Chlamydomonas_euryale.AAC.5
MGCAWMGGLYMGGLYMGGLCMDGLCMDGLCMGGLYMGGLCMDGLCMDGLCMDGLCMYRRCMRGRWMLRRRVKRAGARGPTGARMARRKSQPQHQTFLVLIRCCTSHGPPGCMSNSQALFHTRRTVPGTQHKFITTFTFQELLLGARTNPRSKGSHQSAAKPNARPLKSAKCPPFEVRQMPTP